MMDCHAIPELTAVRAKESSPISSRHTSIGTLGQLILALILFFTQLFSFLRSSLPIPYRGQNLIFVLCLARLNKATLKFFHFSIPSLTLVIQRRQADQHLRLSESHRWVTDSWSDGASSTLDFPPPPPQCFSETIKSQTCYFSLY